MSGPKKSRNHRTQCQDCLKHGMTERVTANTPLLNFRGTPFCTECRPFWEHILLDVPKGSYTHTWKCLECLQTMPLRDVTYKSIGLTYSMDWVHAETCDALHRPCECRVRNKRPGQQRCSVCVRDVHKHLAKADADTRELLRGEKRGRGKTSPRRGNESSPGQDNAIRAMEGD